MAHGHPGAFSIDCFDCQVWADSIDPDLPHRYRSNIPRAGRVAPRSSRVVGEGFHRPSCPCARCKRAPLEFRLFAWIVRQFWDWTPFGQALYWSLALVMTHLYS